ncbi:MAG: hypothetical protein AAFN94_02605 [Pseudomonadota bacterium]
MRHLIAQVLKNHGQIRQPLLHVIKALDAMNGIRFRVADDLAAQPFERVFDLFHIM